jgi:hypothetical protein
MNDEVQVGVKCWAAGIGIAVFGMTCLFLYDKMQSSALLISSRQPGMEGVRALLYCMVAIYALGSV